MPVIHLTPDLDGNYPWVETDLMGMMLFPDDEDARLTATATLIVNNSLSGRDFDEQVSFPVALLRAALAGPGLPGLMKQIAIRARDGFFAGSLLYDFVAQHERGESVLVEEHIRQQVEAGQHQGRFQTYGGKADKAGVSTRHNAWLKYVSVAHFWAAQRHIVGKLGPDEYRSFVRSELGLVAALAMEILQRSASIPTKDGKRMDAPLLDIEKAWVLPADVVSTIN